MTFFAKASPDGSARRVVDGFSTPSEEWLRPAFGTPLETLEVEYVASARVLWVYLRAASRLAHFSPALMRDMRIVQTAIRQDAADRPAGNHDAVRYFVYGSRVPGVFSLGGDLALFAAAIRRGDRTGLSAYAHTCIDIEYANSISFGLPVITIALIQGDALGGGFEYASSFDVVVAERGSKIGLPEILLNFFPGMGVFSFLSRRIGTGRAQEMIMSGRIYGAEELHGMGVVDVLAEPGQGVATVADYISANERKHNAHQAIYRARRRVHPVTEQELRDVVDIWVDAAFGVTEADIRRMERLAAAQTRRFRPDDAGATAGNSGGQQAAR